jgi:GT2 family glycosyltransferase
MGREASTERDPLLSVVVTSYSMGRFEDICNLFYSIKRQSYPSIEVIFVADQLEELEKGAKEFLTNIQLFSFETILNRGQAGVNVCRNIGVESSAGEIVAIVDDDVILPPHWADEMIKSYRDCSVVGVTGPALPLWEDPEKMSWFPKELYFIWGCTVWDWGEVREIRNVGGMNCSFRRKSLLEVGLYRPGLGPSGGEERIGLFHPSGEEVELSLRLKKVLRGCKILYNPAVQVYHKVQNSRFHWGFILHRSFRFGYTKHFLEDLFRWDFPGEDILNLERDHLRHILWHILPSVPREVLYAPFVACRRFAAVFVCTLFACLGYCLYIAKPASKTKPQV